jgi:hypothetical protein
MGADTFTGIVSFMCKNGNNNNRLYKFAIINNQCPDNYIGNIEKFKEFYDLNNLNWIRSYNKAYEIAEESEKIYPTQHGIISIDYTKDEPLEIKIMYASEYKKLLSIKNLIYIIFNFTIYLIYLLFMIKLYTNLH